MKQNKLLGLKNVGRAAALSGLALTLAGCAMYVPGNNGGRGFWLTPSLSDIEHFASEISSPPNNGQPAQQKIPSYVVKVINLSQEETVYFEAGNVQGFMGDTFEIFISPDGRQDLCFFARGGYVIDCDNCSYRIPVSTKELRSLGANGDCFVSIHLRDAKSTAKFAPQRKNYHVWFNP